MKACHRWRFRTRVKVLRRCRRWNRWNCEFLNFIGEVVWLKCRCFESRRLFRTHCLVFRFCFWTWRKCTFQWWCIWRFKRGGWFPWWGRGPFGCRHFDIQQRTRREKWFFFVQHRVVIFGWRCLSKEGSTEKGVDGFGGKGAINEGVGIEHLVVESGELSGEWGFSWFVGGFHWSESRRGYFYSGRIKNRVTVNILRYCSNYISI